MHLGNEDSIVPWVANAPGVNHGTHPDTSGIVDQVCRGCPRLSSCSLEVGGEGRRMEDLEAMRGLWCQGVGARKSLSG